MNPWFYEHTEQLEPFLLGIPEQESKVKGSFTVVTALTALTPPSPNTSVHFRMEVVLGWGQRNGWGGTPPQGNDRKCGNNAKQRFDDGALPLLTSSSRTGHVIASPYVLHIYLIHTGLSKFIVFSSFPKITSETVTINLLKSNQTLHPSWNSWKVSLPPSSSPTSCRLLV